MFIIKMNLKKSTMRRHIRLPILLLILTLTLLSLSSVRSKTLDVGKLEELRNDTSTTRQEVEFTDQETIHLALVCGGYSSTRSLYVLLKSILFYRTDPLHIHLFLDNISQEILHEVFSNWSPSSLEISYYNLTDHEKEVAWITNSHYSHRYGLMKLEVVSILSKNQALGKVIMLDTDMLVRGDIREAWQEFDKFHRTSSHDEKRPPFGMVENQSKWYRDPKAWLAIGEGFNSGTILVDLAALRESGLDWDRTWREDADRQLAVKISTDLADQDIFNAVFASRPWLVHKLPCYLNIQLNDNSRLASEQCLAASGRRGLEILHWNSRDKFNMRNPNAQQYKNWYITFRNWDGKLLVGGNSTTTTTTTTHQEVEKSPHSGWAEAEQQRYCDQMRPNSGDKLRVFPYFIEYDYEAISQFDVSYVVHLSMDRLQVLHELAQSWSGPISAAIYLPEQETDLLMSFIESSLHLSKRRNIGYHLVYRDEGFNYPINRMRNIALDHTVTPYVFLCDIDLLPPANLYDYLRQEVNIAIENMTTDKVALIVPAFESKEYKLDYPADKSDLLNKLSTGEVSEFRSKIWPWGHKQTDYDRWKVTRREYEVQWARDFEPFIVVKRDDVPRFDERFVGFGWNKVEHTMQLAALGYKFLVLPEAFVIHKNHPPSLDIMSHRESQYYKRCIQQLKEAFLRELSDRSPEFMANFNKPLRRGAEPKPTV